MRGKCPLTLALFTLAATTVWAQSPRPAGSTRTDLQRHDLAAPGWETIQARVDFAPGASFPAHRHPGEEIIYVIEGVLEYRLEGGPPRTFTAGQVLFVPAGVYHSARNPGAALGSELATYVVQKGKPLVEFAP